MTPSPQSREGGRTFTVDEIEAKARTLDPTAFATTEYVPGMWGRRQQAREDARAVLSAVSPPPSPSPDEEGITAKRVEALTQLLDQHGAPTHDTPNGIRLNFVGRVEELLKQSASRPSGGGPSRKEGGSMAPTVSMGTAAGLLIREREAREKAEAALARSSEEVKKVAEERDRLKAEYEAIADSGDFTVYRDEWEQLNEAGRAFLVWFDERFPKGQNKQLPGATLHLIAEKFRGALPYRKD